MKARIWEFISTAETNEMTPTSSKIDPIARARVDKTALSAFRGANEKALNGFLVAFK
jgi:hypothetical protein